MVVCTNCNIDKEIIYFWIDKKKKSWLSSWCNECKYSSSKKWRDENKKRMKEYSKEYHKEWYKKNKDEKLKKNKEYAKKNPDIMKKAFDKYIDKPWIREKRNEKTKEWRKNNIEKDRLKCSKRRARIKNSYIDWSITEKAINEMYISQKWLCKICNCDISKWFERDHIIPLSKWWSHTILNIQLLCKFCNRSKRDKILDIN